MKRSGLAAALYVVLVFLSGAVVGIFGYRLYTARSVSASVSVPKPADFRKKYVDDIPRACTFPLSRWPRWVPSSMKRGAGGRKSIIAR